MDGQSLPRSYLALVVAVIAGLILAATLLSAATPVVRVSRRDPAEPPAVRVSRRREEPRPQAGASSKEKALGGCRSQTPAGHSSSATGRGILAFSREPIAAQMDPMGGPWVQGSTI